MRARAVTGWQAVLLGVGLAFGCRAAADAPPAPRANSLREGTLRYLDRRLSPPPPERAWQLSRPFARGPYRDPRYNQPYAFAVQVQRLISDPALGLISDGKAPIQVNYLRPSDAMLARRVASVMARIYWIVQDYLGRGPAGALSDGSDRVHVWLRPDGQAGADEKQGHIYLWAIDEPRAPAEWVRELAHEYAHIYLPRIGPYTDPEPWANGYLGERLILKWLLFDNGVSDLWDRPISGSAYVANQVTPLRTRFLEEGPGSPAAGRTDAAGMDFLIGQVLAIEAAYGPAVVRRLLAGYRAPQPRSLGLFLAEAMKDTPLRLDARAYIPNRSQVSEPPAAGDPIRLKKASYWLFLPGGKWRLEAQGALPDGSAVRVELAETRPVGTGAWELRLPDESAAWRRMELTAPAGGEISLRELVITRAG